MAIEQYAIKPYNLYDTIKISFYLQNDCGRDTTIVVLERLLEYIECHCQGTQSQHEIHYKSGMHNTIRYFSENILYPHSVLKLKKGETYKCLLTTRDIEFFKADPVYLLSQSAMEKYKYKIERYYYNNFIFNYIFLGVISFNILLFSFLFYISKNSVFKWYLFYLLVQLFYGYILMDYKTFIGGIFLERYTMHTGITEPSVFIGLAIYIRFMMSWLDIKPSSGRMYYAFVAALLIFCIYAILFCIMFFLDSHNPFLEKMQGLIRLFSFFIQTIIFYFVLFKTKSFGRQYLFIGSLLLTLFSVVFVLLARADAFNNTYFDDIRTGTWYMIGIMCECFCFSMGLGHYYFNLQKENSNLQIAQLKNVQEKLEVEENKMKERLRISQDLHDQIGSTLSSLAIYSKVALLKDTTKNQELANVLEKMASASNSMVAEMSDIVWAIHPKNDTLKKVISRIESYAKPLASAQNMDCSLDIAMGIEEIQLTMLARNNLYLIAKEAVNNAIKYACANELKIAIFPKEDKLCLKVTDNGVGFQSASPSDLLNLGGNGLINMRSRAEKSGGILEIDSQKGKGTTVLFSFPIQPNTSPDSN